MYFSINHSEITHNRFDDEVIVIHMESARYFSLRETAASIWNFLEKGPVDPVNVAKGFSGDTGGESDALIGAFLSQLEQYGILNKREQLSSDEAAFQPEGELPFSPPLLEPFDDLQELLQADIIHDTDEKGWPHLQQDNSESIASTGAA